MSETQAADSCPELCSRLQSVDFRFTGLDRENSQRLGRWRELLARKECGFCQLVVAAISDSVDPSQVDADEPIDVLLFPGEQSFRLSYPSRVGTHIAFVADSAEQAGGPDSAREVKGSELPASQIVSWLRRCEENHTECMAKDPEGVERDNMPLSLFDESATSNFRVLDLQRDCVTSASLGIKYVSLSYVWGQLPMFRLLRNNFERLSTEGSLQDIRSDLPKTINDAIDLVRAIGERYLWIDSLCLVQDEPDDVSLGIELMNSIYRGSYFTIVAGSGPDADAGLPGVSPGSWRSSQIIMELRPSLRMAVRHSIDWHLSRSVYHSRGWTLQELVLPRRTAIFMNNQVYFRCQEANWSEETWADNSTHWLDPDDSNISRLPDPSSGLLPSLWAYQKLCEEYSGRNLRNDGDALRAVAGLSRPLAAGMRTVMVEGLPGYYIDIFLLFISARGDLRRRPEFASFSWAGWEGKIMWPRENYNRYGGGGAPAWDTSNILEWFKRKCLIKWSALDRSPGLVSLTSWKWKTPTGLDNLMREFPHVFSTNTTDSYEMKRDFIFYSHSSSHMDVPQWDHSDTSKEDILVPETPPMPPRRTGFSIKEFDLANSEAEFARLVQRLKAPIDRLVLQNWMAGRRLRIHRSREHEGPTGPRSTAEGWEASHYRLREPRMAATDPKEQERQHCDRRAACAREWAVKHSGEVASFVVPKFPPYTVLHFHTIAIHLRLGKAAPAVQPDGASPPSPFTRIQGIPLLSSTNQLIGSLHPDNLAFLAQAGGQTIECVVLSRCQTPTLGSALLADRSASLTGAEKPWDLLWVMHVAWRDGIAERRGIGQVLVSALERSLAPGPEVKLVLLG